MNFPFSQSIFLVPGIIFLLTGIILYSGKTKAGKRNFSFAGINFTGEALGIFFFFLGMVLILALLIIVIEPKFSPPGLEGN